MDTSPGRRKRWLWLAVVMTVTGALLLALSVPALASRVAVHETGVFGDNQVVLGPYQLEAGIYVVWIEDYFPGPDDGEIFDVEATDGTGTFDEGWTSYGYTTMTIEGVECEEAAGFDYFEEGDWTFTIEAYNETTNGNAPHVFIVRESTYGHLILFGAGVVCLSLGLITNGLMYWARRSEGPGDDGMHISAK